MQNTALAFARSVALQGLQGFSPIRREEKKTKTFWPSIPPGGHGLAMGTGPSARDSFPTQPLGAVWPRPVSLGTTTMRWERFHQEQNSSAAGLPPAPRPHRSRSRPDKDACHNPALQSELTHIPPPPPPDRWFKIHIVAK